ncbi:sodium-coupled neutral amino acid transporter 4 [Pyrus ussuriensis x Pyrus communis]|uniref:Sodium-coupled neutral amino acid transporter 4 n=1 Tax=Pyrus ussuriensis x Pyrus communis TaxID=2448454 RepID=A0A5N5GDF7_9ROSA|nr:sodium-coupled neutral amino acid transporter 4 [Pyrus ussuriensis x Pyrus communis]
MDSNYSAIPKKSYVELQSQYDSENPENLSKSHSKLSDFDEESFLDSNNLNGNDGSDDFSDNLDFDIGSYPLIVEGSKNGSGISGAVFNLTTSIIGAGIMALPATMKVLGLVWGFVLIILMGILSEISVELLVRFSVLCKASSYGEVVQCALGRPWRIVSEICIIINNAGVLVVYLIIMGDVMSGSLHHIGVFDQWLGHGVWDHRMLLIFAVVVVCLAPLCALEKIDSLSLTSAASVALAVVFVVVACAIAFIKLVEGKIDSPRMSPDFGSTKAILDLLVVIPIMTNAYVCHFNMNRVGRITTVLCIVIYSLTAIAGYLLFGKDTESDILTNFDKDLGIRFSSALNYIVRVGYIFHLLLVFPVVHFSLRQTVDALVFEGSPPLVESRKRCFALTLVLLGLIYLGSTVIPNIWTAFKFTGATTAVSLGFIFPSLIALKLEKTLSWFMLVMAVAVSIVGIIGNIYKIHHCYIPNLINILYEERKI